MGDQNQSGHVSNLIEDSWFFGNTLLNTSNSSHKMVRCNSDPCTSSSTNEETLISSPLDNSKSNSLLRTPSLPLNLGRDRKYQLEEVEDEDEEPRMGDLIRQAMPMPMPMPRRRLDRTPSLPPCRGKQVSNVGASNDEIDAVFGRLSRRESLNSSVLLREKGPIAMTKLTRRASIDSSMLPPKCTTSKGTKQSMSYSKNRPHRKMDPPSTNNATKTEAKPQNLNKSISEKSLSDLEIEELQGFKDLGFSFDSNDITPKVTQLLPALQRTASLDSNHSAEIGKVRRPYLSESWQKPYSPLSAPPVPKRGDQKGSANEDMKAQIKFWARAVASNVRQEC